jgi:hypothetical protein
MMESRNKREIMLRLKEHLCRRKVCLYGTLETDVSVSKDRAVKHGESKDL